ncbi:MAG TPA: hypothetical protein VGG27_10080 [Magnetospirillaceae bacterium]
MTYFVCTNIATCERLEKPFPTSMEALDFAALNSDVETQQIAIIDDHGQSVVTRDRIAQRARELGRDLPRYSTTEDYDKERLEPKRDATEDDA